ncbi:SPOR domain-containing protein (plasmid) [Providencia rettgeri]|uniref:SPOR domain-containing protein n=1 Tax=Providencia rettgeri TaxID=587 RepID=UPI001CA7614D|nr:SPOR domain-containing protein [Providencia rettgeri]QZY66571.1 SPOR domain-containing protein [Providencia rettgeri]
MLKQKKILRLLVASSLVCHHGSYALDVEELSSLVSGVPLTPDISACFVRSESELACWQSLNAEVEPTVWYDFGVHYANGDGVAQDFSRGRYWIHRAAIQGYPLAQYNLGVMFFDGLGGMQSQSCATHWLNKAALDEGDTGMMAMQALQAMAELSTKSAESQPRIYRPMSSLDCETLPSVDFPGFVPTPLVESPALADAVVVVPVDPEMTFWIGLDVLTAALPEPVAVDEPVDFAVASPRVIAPLPPEPVNPDFRQTLGRYFIGLGQTLLGDETEPSFVLSDTSPEHGRQSPKAVGSDIPASTSVSDPSDIGEDLYPAPKVPSLVSDEPLFVAGVLDNPVVAPYDQLDIMVRRPHPAESVLLTEDVGADDEPTALEPETQSPLVAIIEPESRVAPLGESVLAPEPVVIPAPVELRRNYEVEAPRLAEAPAPSSAQTRPVKVEKPVVPVVKTAEAPELNLGGALRNAPNKHYTLQLSSASKAEPLFALAKKHRLSNYLVYETERHGRRWYVLVYGEYAGMTQAKQALQQLPRALKKDTPWIRSLFHVHSEL